MPTQKENEAPDTVPERCGKKKQDAVKNGAKVPHTPLGAKGETKWSKKPVPKKKSARGTYSKKGGGVLEKPNQTTSPWRFWGFHGKPTVVPKKNQKEGRGAIQTGTTVKSGKRMGNRDRGGGSGPKRIGLGTTHTEKCPEPPVEGGVFQPRMCQLNQKNGDLKKGGLAFWWKRLGNWLVFEKT